MSCRTAEVNVFARAYPKGGSSHGPTCCACGRRFVGPQGLAHNAQHLMVGGNINDGHVDRWLQACSLTCAQVLARFMQGSEDTWRRFGGLICPAHSCIRVEVLPR